MFSPHNAQSKPFCGEFYRRNACFRFTFPHKNHRTHCFVGKSQGAKPAPCTFFPTKHAVPTILWENYRAQCLFQVNYSPQKPQYSLFCGESSRCDACYRGTFPHKNRSTHCFVGKTQGAKPAPGTFFPTKHAVPTIMWGNFQPPGPWQFSIYNMSKKTDLLQRFHKKS